MQVKRDDGSRQRCNFSEHVLEIYKLQQTFASLCCRRIVAWIFVAYPWCMLQEYTCFKIAVGNDFFQRNNIE